MSRSIRPALLALVLGACAGPALAMSYQPAPRNSDGSHLVDPDQQTDQRADQARLRDQRVHGSNVLGTKALVQPYGAAATFSFGPPR